MVVLADKEEIGSEGTTGMQCAIFTDLIDAIAYSFDTTSAVIRANSKCLSADVNAAYDPNFKDVNEPMNSTYVSCGAGLPNLRERAVRAVRTTLLPNLWRKCVKCSTTRALSGRRANSAR